MTTGHLDTTKYNAQVANAASQVKISSTVFKNFIADVKDKNDSNYDLLYADSENAIGMKRQALINGNFDVWQRGTSFTNTGGLQYFADRWSGYANTVNQSCTISKQNVSDLNGSVTCLRFQRNAGQTGTNVMVLAQSLETVDSKKLIGKKLTLSFRARIGSGASSNSLAANIVSGTGTDQNVASGYTGAANESSLAASLTTNWQLFTVTTTNPIANTKTEIGAQFTYTPAGTAGANDYFEIDQVQINAGDQALPFQPRSFSEELTLCQRYYEKSYDYSVTPGTASTGGASSIYLSNIQNGYSVGSAPFKVQKRITGATVKVYSPTDGTVNMYNIGGTNIGASISAGQTSLRVLQNDVSTNAGNAQYQWTADAEI